MRGLMIRSAERIETNRVYLAAWMLVEGRGNASPGFATSPANKGRDAAQPAGGGGRWRGHPLKVLQCGGELNT